MKCAKCGNEIDMIGIHYSIETASKRRGEIELCKKCGDRLLEAEDLIEKGRSIHREYNEMFGQHMMKKV